MSAKYVILMVLSFIAGLGFIGCGIYFLSDRFLKKLNEAADFDETKKRRNQFRAKGSGYMAVGVGALTLVFALFIGVMPALVPVLAVVYMIVLVAAFLGLVVIFR